MKIGLVLSAVPGYSETFFKNYVLGLQSRGYRVILFVNKADQKTDFHGATIVSRKSGLNLKGVFGSLRLFFKTLLFLPKCFRYFFNTIINSKTFFLSTKRVYLDLHILTYGNLDWIHFGFGTQGLGREFLAKTLDTKSAVSFRGFDISIYPLKHPNCYESLLKEVDKIHVISDDIETILKKNYTFDYRKTFKITPAINVEKFKSSIKRNWSELSLVSVGRLHWIKGYNYVVEALIELNNRGYEFSYSIIGAGVDYERVAYLAYQGGISDKIIFLGEINHDEIQKYLNESNYFLQYSVQEGFGNAVIEAQASGLISIVSETGGLLENISDGETGFIVPKLKPHLLAQRIEQTHRMRFNEKQQMSDTAAKRVEQLFGVEKQIDAFEKIYK